jgi:prophage antirepressor-like protein
MEENKRSIEEVIDALFGKGVIQTKVPTADLVVVKSENFGDVNCDFYRNSKGEVFMTSKQLGQSLDFSNPATGINNIVDRNEYLKGEQFSVYLKLRATDGKAYNTRLFTEDGIYEVSMLASTKKAQEFRQFVRKVLKEIRKTGKYEALTAKQREIIQRMAEINKTIAESEQQLVEATELTAQYRKCYRTQLQYKKAIVEAIKAGRALIEDYTKSLISLQSGT